MKTRTCLKQLGLRGTLAVYAMGSLSGFLFIESIGRAETPSSEVSREVQFEENLAAGACHCVCPSLEAGRPEALSEEAIATLRREYRNAQMAELKGLEHRQEKELWEYRGVLERRRDEFDHQSRKDKNAYFSKTKDDQSRKKYLQAEKDRRKAYVDGINLQLEQRIKLYDQRVAALKKTHAEHQTEFEKFLEKKDIPPKRLWPQPGRL